MTSMMMHSLIPSTFALVVKARQAEAAARKASDEAEEACQLPRCKPSLCNCNVLSLAWYSARAERTAREASYAELCKLVYER